MVVRICDASSYADYARILVYTAPADRTDAAQVLKALMDDAEGAMSLFRGRALSASNNQGLTLKPVELPAVTRASVVVPEEVWEEIDLNIASVTVRRALMEQLGLGVRRGVLLAGPPGVGKTVISQVISNELVGEFTVIMVDARARSVGAVGRLQRSTKLRADTRRDRRHRPHCREQAQFRRFGAVGVPRGHGRPPNVTAAHARVDQRCQHA